MKGKAQCYPLLRKNETKKSELNYSCLAPASSSSRVVSKVSINSTIARIEVLSQFFANNKNKKSYLNSYLLGLFLLSYLPTLPLYLKLRKKNCGKYD